MINQNQRAHDAAIAWCRRNGYKSIHDYVEKEHWGKQRPMPHLCREIGMSLSYLQKQWGEIRNGRVFIPKRPPKVKPRTCFSAVGEAQYISYQGAQYRADGLSPCRACPRMGRIKTCADDCAAMAEYRADTRIMRVLGSGRDAWNSDHRICI